MLLQTGCTGGAVEKPPDGEPVTADDGGTASDTGGDPADPTQTRTYTKVQTTDFFNLERGFANTGTWDSASGLNSLDISVTAK